MKKVIKVTAQHIKLGHKNRGCFCPIAIALLDAGFNHPAVGGDTMEFRTFENDDGHDLSVLSVPTPKKVAQFIDKFDVSGKGKPFNFVLQYDI